MFDGAGGEFEHAEYHSLLAELARVFGLTVAMAMVFCMAAGLVLLTSLIIGG